MADPVLCADGHTYERAAIAAGLAAHGTSPTGQQVASRDLTPCATCCRRCSSSSSSRCRLGPVKHSHC